VRQTSSRRIFRLRFDDLPTLPMLASATFAAVSPENQR
jgi:hypothetical protein